MNLTAVIYTVSGKETSVAFHNNEVTTAQKNISQIFFFNLNSQTHRHRFSAA